jgi:hypothetical protein
MWVESRAKSQKVIPNFSPKIPKLSPNKNSKIIPPKSKTIQNNREKFLQKNLKKNPKKNLNNPKYFRPTLQCTAVCDAIFCSKCGMAAGLYFP